MCGLVVSTADFCTASRPLELQRETIPVYTMKAKGGVKVERHSFVTWPQIWGCVVKASRPGEAHRHLANRRPQSKSWTQRRKNKSLVLARNRTQFHGCPALDLVITPNALSHLKTYAKINRKYIAHMNQKTAYKVRPAFLFRLGLSGKLQSGCGNGRWLIWRASNRPFCSDAENREKFISILPQVYPSFFSFFLSYSITRVII